VGPQARSSSSAATSEAQAVKLQRPRSRCCRWHRCTWSVTIRVARGKGLFLATAPANDNGSWALAHYREMIVWFEGNYAALSMIGFT